MNKELIIGVIMFLVIGIGVAFLNWNYVKVQQGSPETEISTQTKINENKEEIISAPQVAEHNTAQDCWIIIDKVVYDLTSFSGKHPGGMKAITDNCGADGTRVFETRGDRGPHPKTAKKTLQQFQVGILR